VIGLVKFVFHFFPKETTEYMELAEALSHTPAKRVVLDQMCLKSMQAIISTEKIYEVWYPTLQGIPRDTVSHATGVYRQPRLRQDALRRLQVDCDCRGAAVSERGALEEDQQVTSESPCRCRRGGREPSLGQMWAGVIRVPSQMPTGVGPVLARKMPQARAQSLCSSGLDKIDTDILRTALSFNQHLRMTNFFKADAPSAVAYRFTGARRPLASLLQPCSLRAIA